MEKGNVKVQILLAGTDIEVPVMRMEEVRTIGIAVHGRGRGWM